MKNSLLSGKVPDKGFRVYAFTLVELIVVITILAILATIGFVSFSGYLAGTRDTNRIAQLKSMSDALELYRTKKDLPIPDDKVDVKADGEVIAYQGDIGKNVLETIEYTESGLDPKYKEYFTYYLTKNKKYFQLMAFLEEESDDVVAMAPHPNPLLRGEGINHTFAGDYADKYPHVQGKKLGILTDIENNPIQKVEAITGSGFIETKTATGYIAYVDNGKKLIDKEIGGLKEIAKLGGIEQNLVAWYDFETIDGTGFLDLSGHHYTGEIKGSLPIVDGKIGKAMNFDGTVDNYIILPNEVLNGLKDFSIFGWMNMKDYQNVDPYYSRLLLDVWSTGEHDVLALFDGKKGAGVSINAPFMIYSGKYNNLNTWYHIGLVKNGNTMSLFVNGKKVQDSSSGAIDNMTVVAEGIVIGQEQDGSTPLGGFQAEQAMKGELDDLRIYEGTMSEGRIEKIYRLGRR